MDTYLQTNNDLIVSIHKTFVDTTQELNRKIENLRDDIRDVKLSLANSDRTMQEEATNWRRHTENIVHELGERHQQEMAGLHKILMELCIRSTPTSSGQLTVAAAPTEIRAFGHQHVPEVGMDDKISVSQKQEEPLGFKPPLPVQPNLSTVTTTNVGAVAAPVVTTTPIVATVTKPVSLVKEEKKAPSVTTTAVPSPGVVPVATTAPMGTVLPFAITTTMPSAPIFRTTTTTTTSTMATIPSTTAITSVPTTVTFSFSKGPSGGGGGGGNLFQGMTTGASLFGGGAKSGTNTFANLAAQAGSGGGFLGGTAVNKPPSFGQSPFGSGTAKEFKLFQQSSPQPSLNSSIRGSDKGADESQRDESSDKEDQNEEFVPDVHYEPVVPLPPEVEVATGEEGEDVLFSARCKLYRYDKDSRENKERGLGDIKLLFNSRTKRYRCVMRREQVFKLCANFPIYPDLKLKPREQMPTVYTWACKDFSEDPHEGIDETFSARFKDKAIAEEFFNKMMEAVSNSAEQ